MYSTRSTFIFYTLYLWSYLIFVNTKGFLMTLQAFLPGVEPLSCDTFTVARHSRWGRSPWIFPRWTLNIYSTKKSFVLYIFLNLPVWICQWFDSYNWIHLGIVEHWFRQCEQGCKILGVNLYNKVRLKVFSIPPKCLYKFNPSGTVFWTCWTHRFVFFLPGFTWRMVDLSRWNGCSHGAAPCLECFLEIARMQ